MHSKLDLISILPSGLAAEWPTVHKGVVKLLDYAGSETPMSRIYNDILTGQCVLWKGVVDGQYVGFVTTRVEKIPFEAWQNPYIPHISNLIIAQLYIVEGSDPNVFMEGMRQIEEYAKSCGCAEIKFYSMRDKAFERRMSPFGWKATYTEFIKKVNKEN